MKMDDLISRAEFLKGFSYHAPEERFSPEEVIYLLKKAPTVAAEPVRHGDWVRTSPATWECSVCRAPYRGTPVRPNWSRYCHNCGARMDREQFVGINKTSDAKEDAE